MSELNLYQKIVAVRKSIDAFKKDKKNYKYDYVSGNQVLSKIEGKMNELNLLLIPAALDGEYEPYTYKTRNGETTDLIVKGRMTYTWINGDKPEERMEVPWFYYGQMEEVSKAFGSALTYSERYFLLKVFGIPTDNDDPDAKQGDKPTKKPTQTKGTLSEAQVKRFYAIARANGYNSKQANLALEKKYKLTDPRQLSKNQYDEVCNAMNENKKKAGTIPTPGQIDAVIDEGVPF